MLCSEGCDVDNDDVLDDMADDDDGIVNSPTVLAHVELARTCHALMIFAYKMHSDRIIS